jgi:hypothetical protein
MKKQIKQVSSCLILCGTFMLPPLANGADLWVNNETGKDTFDGRSATATGQVGPFASIAKAVKLAKPGDTVHLAATAQPYRQSIAVTSLQGEAGKPITFDGHGAWLTGAEHLSPEQWAPAEAGPKGTLTLKGVTLASPWTSTLCIDGKMLQSDINQDALPIGAFYWWQQQKTLYCRFSPELAKASIEVGLADGTTLALPPTKWGHTNFPKVPGLKRNRDLKQVPAWVKINGKEAPLLAQPALDQLAPGHFYNDGKTFFYRPPAGKTIADVQMMIVLRSSGVALSGTNRHLVFKNLNAVYFGNDGYNIHGDSKDITFLNCNAFYVGDEGFSAHERCETFLDGGIYVETGNGIHNVNNCSTIIRNVIVVGTGAGIHNDRSDTKSGIRPHEITNAILAGGFVGTVQSKIDNVLIVDGGMHLKTGVSVKHATVAGGKRLLRVDKGSSVNVESSLFAANKGAIHARLADPALALSFKDTWFEPTTVIEWGARYPWTTKPLGEWMSAHPNNASNGKAIELGLPNALKAGTIPEALIPGMGCTRELLQRYLDFQGKRQALLDEAQNMAWKK